MNGFRRFTRVISLCVCLIIMFGTLSVGATGNEIRLKAHNLSLTLPEEYTVMNADNADAHEDVLETLGYTVSSFESYLKTNALLFFALDSKTGTQVSLKSWESEFSADVDNMRLLSDTAMASVAKELVTIKGATYKAVTVGSLQLLEIRHNDTDSGGKFGSVQYLTICNGKFYSLSFLFSGALDDAKVQTAWEIATGLDIVTKATGGWEWSSVLQMVLIWALLLFAAGVAGLLLWSLIKDIRNRRQADSNGEERITRRR